MHSSCLCIMNESVKLTPSCSPGSVCGGLTVSITFGFMHGLLSGKVFHSLKSVQAKTAMWRRRYISAFFSAVTLAMIAQLSLSPVMAALAVSLASATMASSVSFQFYQCPAMVSGGFLQDKAVCLSFIDGLGFLVAVPVWALTGRIVRTLGWSAAWSLMATMIGIGGVLMNQALPSILQQMEKGAAVA